MKYTKCNDTGVVETGNNDFPCDCDASNNVRFNVAGVGSVLGSQLKRLEQVRVKDPVWSGELQGMPEKFNVCVLWTPETSSYRFEWAPMNSNNWIAVSPSRSDMIFAIVKAWTDAI